jgi:segregation and condensation protein A
VLRERPHRARDARGATDEDEHGPIEKPDASRRETTDEWERPERVPISPVLHLDGFDGPLDRLLDLAERQRLDWRRLSIVDLIAQRVTAVQHFASRIALERRADWLVLASRLVLRHARLLVPASRPPTRRPRQSAAGSRTGSSCASPLAG